MTGANVLVAIFAERESHAAYFLQEQEMTRYDAVNFISHGISKRAGASETRPVRGAEEEQGGPGGEEEGGKRKSQQDALTAYCVNLNEKARTGKIDPLIGRAEEINRTIQVLCRRSKNNPPLRRRSRRRQDGDRRGSGQNASSKATCLRFWPMRRSSRSTWVRCSPALAIAAISRSG